MKTVKVSAGELSQDLALFKTVNGSKFHFWAPRLEAEDREATDSLCERVGPTDWEDPVYVPDVEDLCSDCMRVNRAEDEHTMRRKLAEFVGEPTHSNR